jgi:ATP diphosphatase
MMTRSRDISRLLDIMAMLRTPGSGCPWDLEQNFATIAPYTIEEAYEVADAIARRDLADLRDELGDLLLQVVFHARMAEEQNAFSFGDVVEAINAKMIRRHPHVFADKDGRLTPADVKGAWDRIKAEEKAERAARRPHEEAAHKSLLSGVKAGQPALARAMELQRKASSVGFDWNDPRAVLHKIREEADEIEAALKKPATCCSRWSIWRGMSAPIRNRRCAAPMPNSNAASATSNGRWQRRAVRSRAPPSPRWMRCGTRRRRRNKISRNRSSPRARGTRRVEALCPTPSFSKMRLWLWVPRAQGRQWIF